MITRSLSQRLEAGFKELIAMFELPLLGGLLARLKKGEAFGCWVGPAEWLGGTGGIYAGEVVRLLPEAGARKKAVLKRGAGHLFQVEIREVEVERGSGVLVGEIDARDALIVCGESHWDTCGTVV